MVSVVSAADTHEAWKSILFLISRTALLLAVVLTLSKVVFPSLWTRFDSISSYLISIIEFDSSIVISEAAIQLCFTSTFDILAVL